MEGYLIFMIFISIAIIFIAIISIKKDINNSEKILYRSEEIIQKLEYLLKDAAEAVEELDAFGAYVVDLVEQKAKEAIRNIDENKIYYEFNIKETNVVKQEENKYEEMSENISSENDEVVEDNKLRKESIYKKVMELYEQGIKMDDIANQLSLGKGEVKLAIRLLGGRKSEKI